FSLTTRPPPRSTLFPSTTLIRSRPEIDLSALITAAGRQATSASAEMRSMSECLMTAISPAWRRLVRSFVRRSSRAGAGPDRVGAAGVSRCLRTFMVGPLSHVPVAACVLDLACRVEQLRGVGLRRGGFVHACQHPGQFDHPFVIGQFPYPGAHGLGVLVLD